MPWWKHLPFYYGWVIVAVTFVCFAVGFVTFHSFSVFYVAILEEFGWPRAATAGAFSLFALVNGLNSVVAGGLVDRFGPRLVSPLAAILLGIGLMLMAGLSTLWQFYLLFGIVAAVGFSGFGPVPAFAVLNNWFVKKRGTASGLVMAGIGIGMLLLIPLLQTIITRHGWRIAYVALAIATLSVIPVLTFTFYRHRPQELGLMPDGEARLGPAAMSRSEAVQADVLIVDKEWAAREWTLGSALRTPRFWQVFFAQYLEVLAVGVFSVHQVAFFVGMGYDRLLAASVVGVVGIVGSSAKVLWGVVSDRIGREMTYTLGYVGATLAAAIALSVRSGSPEWMPYAYAVAYGFGYAVIAVQFPVVSADIFHGRGFGAILGGLSIGGSLGAATGAFVAGYVYDLTSSYTWAFAAAVLSLWLACLLYWLAAPRKVRVVAGRARKVVDRGSEDHRALGLSGAARASRRNEEE